MRRSGSLLLGAAARATLAALVVGCAAAAGHERPPFRFEEFEPWGLHPGDEVAATAALLEHLLIGTPLDEYRRLFDRLGGRCFELPRDYPGRLICLYSHMKYPPLSIGPTWSVDIWYDAEKKVSTRLKVTPGMEGL